MAAIVQFKHFRDQVSHRVFVKVGRKITDAQTLLLRALWRPASGVDIDLDLLRQSTRVGDVSIELKKADPKKNRFTIQITADDKTVEKKDRTVNEPIQFYTSKARQPYEIVVNSVKKDTIAGYLATPKVQTGRGGA